MFSDDASAEDGQPSLDQLSQAFAEAMGRNKPPSADAEGEFASTPVEASADSNDPLLTEREAGDAACPISPRSILEAILFVGHPDDAPITGPAVAALLPGVEPAEIDVLVSSLNEDYAEHGLPLRIESVGSGYRLQLSNELSYLRERFYGRIREARLSRAAIDVLAVVAYNQPVTRQFVDDLVGGSSGRILSQLVRRQLLAQQTSPDQPRKKEYVTTDRFLELFGLGHLQDLPRSDEPE